MSQITYRQNGDYLIPDLTIEPPPSPTLGKYGLMLQNHLKNHRTAKYNGLLLSGFLPTMLQEADETIPPLIEQTVAALMEKNPPPDKASDPQAWTRHMNSLQAQAEELILIDHIWNK